MKQIHCLHCGAAIEVPDEIVNGQHILCPYCNKKFSFADSQAGSSQTQDVTTGRVSKEFDWMKLIKVLAVILGLCMLAIAVDRGSKMPHKPTPPKSVECVSCGSLVPDTVANRVNFRTIQCPVCGKMFKHVLRLRLP